jgi:nitrite reductase/ring-hydroxylating ferredoxin subunit
MPGPDDGSQPLEPALEGALGQLDALVESFENDPDPTVQERGLALLQAVDAVHRSGLGRLASYLERLDGEVRRRALSDPAVRVLLELYDLLPPQPPPLTAGFVPLKEMTLKLAPERQWVATRPLAELPPDTVVPVTLRRTRVLLARVGDDVYAYRNGCGSGPMPLDSGRREGDVLVCPWHDCRYELASGRLLNGLGEGLEAFPAAVIDGQIRVNLAGGAQAMPVAQP